MKIRPFYRRKIDMNLQTDYYKIVEFYDGVMLCGRYVFYQAQQG